VHHVPALLTWASEPPESFEEDRVRGADAPRFEDREVVVLGSEFQRTTVHTY
jgi:hypothetical protein